MKLAVDLHIHSCLSPCADDDMTPYNIAAMASVKGLAAISVCDHNACLNSAACAAACDAFGIVFVPGVEITTQEEIHALCYFADITALQDFCAMVEQYQPLLRNKPELFGHQVIISPDDEVVGECDRLLFSAVMLPLETVEQEALRCGGVLVPSHINKSSNSLLSNLGFIPPNLQARVMEISGNYELPQGFRSIRSSDAHSRHLILEHGFPLDVDFKSCDAILNVLRQGL